MSLSLPESLRLLLPDGTARRVLLEDYLRGVVAAALPADASLEAMKALAVAARTFAAHTHRHLDRAADLCTLRHCQAWSERANPRAARAVIETRGIVATHHEQFIEAFYFEHCDGKTREAMGVLVNAPTYLKSVTCPCGFASLKGHGIGMCLRGMAAMARFGENFDFILKHYYTGITLEQISIDEATRAPVPLTPPKIQPAPVKRAPAPRPRPTPPPVAQEPPATPAAPVVAQPPAASAAPAEKPVAEKPARKTSAPRRSTRQKVEHNLVQPHDQPTAQPLSRTTAASDSAAGSVRELAYPTSRLGPKPEAEEADDFLAYLAVEDIAPPKPAEPAPPPSFAAPPDSMPEEMPTALELEFIAPPVGHPETLQSDFLALPPATVIEPDLDAFIPPVEKFYTPLDAPPSMPEELPWFSAARADETPIAWVPPPPLFETAEAQTPKILTDYLPGPRVIAGNLAKSGVLVTVRDAQGNSIVTVSGAAKHYGAGGFEAPLTDDGAYRVKFDGVELDVKLENETVFVYYQ